MHLGDFHIHSCFSDGKLTIPQIVDFYGQRGFKVISITDHVCESNGFMGRASHYLRYTLTPATFPLYQALLKSEAYRAWNEYGMLLIPGVELSKNSITNHRSAHILGLGVRDYISAELPVEKMIEEIHKQGGIAVAAHPVPTGKIEKQTLYLWSRRQEYRELFDAWEVASGPHLFRDVPKSGLPMLANSDFHHSEQIISWKTIVDADLNEKSILSAICRQKLEFHFFHGGNHDDAGLGAFCSLLRKPATAHLGNHFDPWPF